MEPSVEVRPFLHEGCELAGVAKWPPVAAQEDIDRLETEAGIHRKVFGFHRLLSKRFPFAIYYDLTAENEATVFRILDCRRNPAWIESNLKES